MSQKIFDILPPEKIKREIKEEKKKRHEFKVSFYIPLVLISVFLFCYFTLSKATIEIWPESEVLTFETKITVDKKSEQLDIENKVIPGEIFKAEKTIAEEFSSSGSALKEKKSEGVIRVYNEYSTNKQILIARTRFVSADGKLFRTPIKVTIPGGRYEKGKFVSGYLDVNVKADQPGPEYNIGPSTFSIPGFAGTARYTKFYGKSFKDMTGGVSQKIPQVTKDDLDKAQKTLKEKVLDESKITLKEKIPQGFILLENTISSEILETFSLTQEKEEKEKFNFQVKAEATALVFQAEDVENLAKEYIVSQISADKKLYQESLKLSYSPETIDLDIGKISLYLSMEAKIYSDIGQDNLKKGLRGKSLSETRIFLENQPEIVNVKISFWPFWVKKVPDDIEKIEMKLKLD